MTEHETQAVAEGPRDGDALWQWKFLSTAATAVRKWKNHIEKKACNREITLEVTQGRRKWRYLTGHISLPTGIYNNW